MSKKLYEQPTTKVLVVRVEQSLLTGSIRSLSNQGTETLCYDADEDL